MSEGISIQSVEFMADGVVAFSWAYEEDLQSQLYGEIRKSWVSLDELPDHVGELLLHAVDLLVDEFTVWKQGVPDTIEPPS
jgi:hypothetical protein